MHAHPAVRERRFPIYAVMLYVGLLAALFVGDRLARQSGLDPVRVVAAFLISIPVCLAGARALAVVLGWSHYRERPREILRVRHGGAAMYGALPPALLLSIPLLAWLELPFGAFWDVAFVAILAGMIPTRFGCLGSGCCAGRRTRSRFGLRLRNARGVRERRFPNPLFEVLLGAALLLGALALWGRLPFQGAIALLVVTGYGAGRFALEGLREERAARRAGLDAFQWMSAALFLVGVVGLAFGSIARTGTAATTLAAASDPGGTVHLIAAGLLLLPILHLFRFLGCSLLLSDADPAVATHLLQMVAVVPDVGTGEASVRIQFQLEPGLDEIEQSPVDLAPAGQEPDRRLRFEALEELPEGAYVATCTVSRLGALTRIGSCSGELNGPGLLLAFNAENADGPTELEARLCFEPAP